VYSGDSSAITAILEAHIERELYPNLKNTTCRTMNNLTARVRKG
jgi:hypothetical protein